MDIEKKPKPKPNTLLRRQRELRNFTLQDVADKLYEMCIKEGRESGISADTVGRWERGVSQPEAHYRAKLCELFGKSTTELGLIEQEPVVESSQAPTPPSTSLLPSPFGEEQYNGANLERGAPLPVHKIPVVLIPTHQAIALLRSPSDSMPEQRLGTLLALEANELTAFFDEGWSVEELLESLRVVLQGVQMMSKITRRTFGRRLLELGAAAVVSGVPIMDGKHISVEDRVKLHNALGESIAAGWKLFHTSGNAQVLAVGQAQLYLVQQNHSLLYSSVQPLFYSGVYRLIGAAQHFQGRYQEAFQAHEKAYIAALEGADAWNMAQSRGWQAYGLREHQNYVEAIQMADAALRLVSYQSDTESIRLRARLLAFSAENAAFLGDAIEVQRRLDASKELLEYLPGYHEEFDQLSWLQQAGTCALNLKQYDVAVTHLQQALDRLPAQWTLRAVSTAIPLASALTQKKELNYALALIEKTLPIVKASQSPVLVQEFVRYLQTELLAGFPHDSRCQSCVIEAQRQLTIA